MKYSQLFLGAVFASFTLFAAAEPENLSVVKTQLRTYYDSGAYSKEMSAAVLKAEAYLQKRVAENAKAAHPKKLAIVFDIDETLLSNYSDMNQEDFGFNANTWSTQVLKADDPALPATKQLYDMADQDHVTIFIITGRKEKFRSATILNLRRVGLTGWHTLVLEPNTYHLPSAIPYKSNARKVIEAEGYDIVMTIGDQYSDLKGGYADHLVKLPDPFYYLP